MSDTNGNGRPPPDPPGDSYEHRLSRWMSDAKRTGTIPRYIAERVEPPPAWLRKVLGPPAIRLTPGKGRIYPRAEWIWRWVVLASVLTLGSWCLSEARAARRASERCEATTMLLLERTE